MTVFHLGDKVKYGDRIGEVIGVKAGMVWVQFATGITPYLEEELTIVNENRPNEVPKIKEKEIVNLGTRTGANKFFI